MATTGRPPPAVLSGGRCGPGEGTVPVPGSQKKVQAAEGAGGGGRPRDLASAAFTHGAVAPLAATLLPGSPCLWPRPMPVGFINLLSISGSRVSVGGSGGREKMNPLRGAQLPGPAARRAAK